MSKLPCLFAFAVMLLVGCSSEPKRQTVHGHVTFKGKPLTSGVVRMYSTDGRMSVATIRPDGTFAVTDVLVGEVKVAVVPNQSDTMPPATKGKPIPKEKMPPPAAPSRNDKPGGIPAKYRDANTSGLVLTVTPKMTEDIELKLE